MENDKKQVKKTIIISILVIIGFLITIDLAIIYYNANFNKYAMPSFCSISDFIDCDGVARTTESQFLGVPLAYWGMFLYSFILMLLGADKLKKIPLFKFLEVFKNKFHYIASLGLISFIISMVLLFISYFEIQKLCIMCAVTYVIDLMIALFAVEGIKDNFIGAIKQSWIDFVDALKPLPYRIAFIVVMLLASYGLYWTFSTAKFSPALKVKRNYGEFLDAKTNKYAIKGNVLGSKSKDALVVDIYSDYRCPMCNVFNMMVHKLAKDFENVRFEHHSLPLDMECNKHLQQPFHIGSCVCAQYAEAAYNQGKFWEVNSLLFDVKPSTEEEIIEVLKTSGFDLDMDKLQKDAHSQEVMDRIQKDIETAVEHDKLGTPTMAIGDKFEMGVPKSGYPGLKQWLIENGGKPKHIF